MMWVKRGVPKNGSLEKLLEGEVDGHDACEGSHSSRGGSSERTGYPTRSLVVHEA